MKITEYRVLSNENLLTLISGTNDYIKEGWQPQGGVSAVPATEGNNGGFFQAIVR